MQGYIQLILTHAIAGWLIVATAFLLLELTTMSGWLLWPAASAAAVAMIARFWTMDLPSQAMLFAMLTIVNTLLGRRLMANRNRVGRDPNDADRRVVGMAGKASSNFRDGVGRVLVDGKEWAAESEPEDVIVRGDKIYVTALIDGARLKVRPSQKADAPPG